MAQDDNHTSVRLQEAGDKLNDYLDRVEQLTGHRPPKGEVIRIAVEDYCENPPVEAADMGASA
jgi:hypothetical protein